MVKTEAATTKERKIFKSFDEIMGEPIEVKQLIGSLIPGGCTCQIFGPSGDGKTFIALDMALSVATGGEWNGLPCKQGLVIYFNGEGQHGFKLRCRAWHQHHQITSQVYFYSSEQAVSFDAGGIALAIAEIKNIEKQSGQKVALIVIDTLARHIEGDENSTREMCAFIRIVDDMRNSFADSTAIIVHHTGNGAKDRSRGNSSLKAALDVEIRCMDNNLTFFKVKDGEKPAPLVFRLQVVELGTNEDGSPITSCAVVLGDKSQAQKQIVAKLSPYDQQGLDALVVACIAENGIKDLVDGKYSASLDSWREEFYKLSRHERPALKQGTLKTRFRRVKECLLGMGLVNLSGSGAAPLPTALQDKIYKTILPNGTRDNDGTTAVHVPKSEEVHGTHTLKVCAGVPPDLFYDMPPDLYDDMPPDLFDDMPPPDLFDQF